ncbi:hypothetical protein H8B02_42840 [Bradyrhizobium sp. Pear77]|uniref:hypothetical protein n=1 Tax=Bradyrhizobium altum TaxID=1571202 RepID=UPI001E52DC08|nr:hypothetical protein [Bradyrhizobium altum]MCC8959909.1 hypothetical protein [Bradyrhizobium altum]
MRDHFLGAHPLAGGMIEEVGRQLRADRIGIETIGHGVVMREHQRLVGVEGGVGHRRGAFDQRKSCRKGRMRLIRESGGTVQVTMVRKNRRFRPARVSIPKRKAVAGKVR